ncbi:hypothetical protein BGZ72_004641 [Mortierella alpina]|nr:hypothetical protein BGZ72_004641 [Mortierella alpina]
MIAQIDRDAEANGFLLPASNDFGLIVPSVWFAYLTQTIYKKAMLRLGSRDADYIVESDGAIAQIWKPLEGGCFDPAAAMQGLGFDTRLKGPPFCSGSGGRQAVTVTSDGYVIEAAIIEPGYEGKDTYQLLYRREYKITTFPVKNRGKATFINTGAQQDSYYDVGTPWEFHFAKKKAWQPKEDVMNFVFNGSTVREHIISAMFDSYNFQGVDYTVSLTFQVTTGWILYHLFISAVGIMLLVSSAFVFRYRLYNSTLSSALVEVANQHTGETASVAVEYGVEPDGNYVSLVANGKILTTVTRNFEDYDPSCHRRVGVIKPRLP